MGFPHILQIQGFLKQPIQALQYGKEFMEVEELYTYFRQVFS